MHNLSQDRAREYPFYLKRKGEKNVDQTEAYKSTLFAVRGVRPHLVNSQGSAWSAKYINNYR